MVAGRRTSVPWVTAGQRCRRGRGGRARCRCAGRAGGGRGRVAPGAGVPVAPGAPGAPVVVASGAGDRPRRLALDDDGRVAGYVEVAGDGDPVGHHGGDRDEPVDVRAVVDDAHRAAARSRRGGRRWRPPPPRTRSSRRAPRWCRCRPRPRRPLRPAGSSGRADRRRRRPTPASRPRHMIRTATRVGRLRSVRLTGRTSFLPGARCRRASGRDGDGAAGCSCGCSGGPRSDRVEA